MTLRSPRTAPLRGAVPGFRPSQHLDVGRPAPALLYVSIPNTHAELYGAIDRVLDDVDVL